jgi:hypothetical protein
MVKALTKFEAEFISLGGNPKLKAQTNWVQNTFKSSILLWKPTTRRYRGEGIIVRQPN